MIDDSEIVRCGSRYQNRTEVLTFIKHDILTTLKTNNVSKAMALVEKAVAM